MRSKTDGGICDERCVVHEFNVSNSRPALTFMLGR